MSFLERLVDQSSLTPRQMQALTNYLRVASRDIKLREAAASVPPESKRQNRGKPLTIGAYYRTVSQARSNVKQSLVTVVIALRLGAIKVEDVRRLFDLVGGGTRDLSDEEADRFLQLLDILLRRIVV